MSELFAQEELECISEIAGRDISIRLIEHDSIVYLPIGRLRMLACTFRDGKRVGREYFDVSSFQYGVRDAAISALLGNVYHRKLNRYSSTAAILTGKYKERYNFAIEYIAKKTAEKQHDDSERERILRWKNRETEEMERTQKKYSSEYNK